MYSASTAMEIKSCYSLYSLMMEIQSRIFVRLEYDNVTFVAIQKTNNHDAIDNKDDQMCEQAINLIQEIADGERDQEIDSDY